MSLLIQQQEGSTCDFSNAQSLPMGSIEISLSTLKTDVTRNQEHISNQIDYQGNNIAYSHIRVDDIRRMIDANPDCFYLRVYNAKGEDGIYYHVITPVLGSGYDKEESSTEYLKCCCPCPPGCRG